jgi:ABC-type spermidine/putrescine transport system permease subunit II
MGIKSTLSTVAAKAACLLLAAPVTLLAQGTAISTDKSGQIVNDTYGNSTLWYGMTQQSPQLYSSLLRICGIIAVLVQLGAAVGILAALWNMFLAAKNGEGFSGRWRVSLVLLVVSGILVAPKTSIQMFGLDWMVTASGPMGCLVGSDPFSW